MADTYAGHFEAVYFGDAPPTTFISRRKNDCRTRAAEKRAQLLNELSEILGKPYYGINHGDGVRRRWRGVTKNED